MPLRSIIIAGAALLAVAACSRTEPPPPAAPAQPVKVAAKPATKSGDELPAPRCPARVDPSLGGPDIVGFKLGMTREAALNFARCHAPQAVLSYEGTWIQGLKSYGIQLAPQVFVARSGDSEPCKFTSFEQMQKCGPDRRVWTHEAEKITVVSPGVPGRERVMGVWREQQFKPGEMPAAESVLQALTQKYGPPQSTSGTPGQWARLDWLQDPSGASIDEQRRGRPSCRSISPRAQDAHSWSEACGLTMAAMVMLSRENPLLVKSLHVGMLHQSALFETGRRLQDELQAMEARRRQDEVEQSKSSGAKVKL
jgi:hypothetical protein